MIVSTRLFPCDFSNSFCRFATFDFNVSYFFRRSLIAMSSFSLDSIASTSWTFSSQRSSSSFAAIRTFLFHQKIQTFDREIVVVVFVDDISEISVNCFECKILPPLPFRSHRRRFQRRITKQMTIRKIHWFRDDRTKIVRQGYGSHVRVVEETLWNFHFEGMSL